MFLKIVGFVVVALFVGGVVKGAHDVIVGEGTTQDIPVIINNEFAGIGVSVPAQRQGPGAPAPYQSVPQGTDLSRDLERLGAGYPATPGTGR